MITLFCAFAVGQIQPHVPPDEVAKLRAAYERAETNYDRTRVHCKRMQDQYEKLRVRNDEGILSLDANLQSHLQKMKLPDERQQELRRKFEELQSKHRSQLAKILKSMRTLMHKAEVRMLQSRQSADQAKRKYEQAAGRLREYWA